jgi:hypothetical protein
MQIEFAYAAESSSTANDGYAEVRINGARHFLSTSLNNGTSTVDAVRVGLPGDHTAVGSNALIDDLILSTDRWVLGDVTVGIAVADANGSLATGSAWTAVGDTTYWRCVDDYVTTGHDLDTTYVRATTFGATVSVSLESAAAAGIPAGRDVEAIMPFANVRDTGSLSSLKLLAIVGEDEVQGSIGNPGTSYTQMTWVSQGTFDDPDQLWSTNDLSTWEVGLYDGRGAIHEARCTAIGAHVLYRTTSGARNTNSDDVAFADEMGTEQIKLLLGSPSPNPFNNDVSITFVTPEPGPVALAIYDVHGRRIQSILDGTIAAGDHIAVWNGREQNGRNAPAGTYFLRLESANGGRATRQIVLVR